MSRVRLRRLACQPRAQFRRVAWQRLPLRQRLPGQREGRGKLAAELVGDPQLGTAACLAVGEHGLLGAFPHLGFHLVFRGEVRGRRRRKGRSQLAAGGRADGLRNGPLRRVGVTALGSLGLSDYVGGGTEFLRVGNGDDGGLRDGEIQVADYEVPRFVGGAVNRLLRED